MAVLPACMYIHHAWCLQMIEEDIGSPGTGNIHSCYPPYRIGEPNYGPLQEQVLLTPEQSHQPLMVFFLRQGLIYLRLA